MNAPYFTQDPIVESPPIQRQQPPHLVTTALLGIIIFACAGCSAVYDRQMQNGRNTCFQIDDPQRRNDCLRYYSQSYDSYEDEVRKIRKGDTKNSSKREP
jgi:hypothetical protein